MIRLIVGSLSAIGCGLAVVLAWEIGLFDDRGPHHFA